MHDDGRAPAPDEANTPALLAQPDHYSLLVSAIAKASHDPVHLRGLVYTIAAQSLTQDEHAPDPFPDPVAQAKTLIELERALQFEHAIFRIERQAAEAQDEPADDEGLTPSEMAAVRPGPSPEHLSASLAHRLPSFLNPLFRISLDAVQFARAPRRALRTNLLAFTQLIMASVIGAALYTGIANWMREHPAVASLAFASTIKHQHIPRAGNSFETVGSAHPASATKAAGVALPFPVPKAYGVYAGNNGRVSALPLLPLGIPTARFQMSAEIKEPSRTVVSGDNLTFVVFGQGLGGRALGSITLRVVARVMRATTFVDGRPTVTPIGAEWRVRDNSYALEVSPADGNPDMLVVGLQAGAVLPPGRYALVVDGQGYDFTVAGPITASEQCLEQFQLQNGAVLSECPKS